MLRLPASNERERERDEKVQVSTASATILVISCHSCSIVKLIEVYITEPCYICSSYESVYREGVCVCGEWRGVSLSPVVTLIHVIFRVFSVFRLNIQTFNIGHTLAWRKMHVSFIMRNYHPREN